MTDLANFKALLDAKHKWPGAYLFKFICNPSQVARLIPLFGENEVIIRESAQGKYVSLTVTMQMHSSEGVIEIYQRAAALVPDLIAL